MSVTYESIGGELTVNAVVDELYKRILADPELKGQFDGVNLAKLKKHQADFLTTALGGPGSYKGRSLTEAHAGLHITVDQFERVVDHLTATLMSFGVDFPTVQEIIQRVMSLQESVVQEN